jgi:hypothetical protein
MRRMNDRLTLGAEVYHRSPATADAAPFTGVNIGGTYKLSAHWSLLAAAGPGPQNARRQAPYAFYLALEANF